ncbi:Uncharacterised protein [uncultured archaeon]|nr:Uncharacterised protein [uncultured archaeon]
MNAKWAIALTAFLAFLLSGCLLQQPVPLNESGLLPPHPTYPNATSGQGPYLSLGDMNLEGMQGAPVVCTVDGIPGMQNITLYMLGSSVRSEYLSPETNSTYVTVIKGDLYYIKGGQNVTTFENCSWVLFNKTSFKESGFDAKTPYGARAPNYTAVPGMPKCSAGSFGQDVFRTNGTVCDFNALLAQTASATFNCSVITDPGERDQCEKYYDKNITIITNSTQ